MTVSEFEQWTDEAGVSWRREGGRLLWRDGMVWREYRMGTPESDEERDGRALTAKQ